jgi:hypothetical protein
MCVDFVEAKTGTRNLVSLAEEMDVFGREMFRESEICGQKFWEANSKIREVGPHAFLPTFGTASREF